MVPVLADRAYRRGASAPSSSRSCLLAITLLVVAEGHRASPAGSLPVGFVWIGVHGSWPLGVVALGDPLGRLARGSTANGPSSGGRRGQVARWPACLIGGIANPYGPALLLFFPLRAARQQRRARATWSSGSRRAFDSLVDPRLPPARARDHGCRPALAGPAGMRPSPRCGCSSQPRWWAGATSRSPRLFLLPGLAGGAAVVGDPGDGDRRSSEAVRLAVDGTAVHCSCWSCRSLADTGAPHLDLGPLPRGRP